jgi:hypothetical protein
VTFVRPEKWLGTWREVDADSALVELAHRYLRAYGPATPKDFTRWWGTWAGVGKSAWTGLAKDLVSVSIEGQRADMLASDLGRIEAMSGEPTVRLLPPFDPYLMGYSTRDHLFAAEHSSRVSRTAGWISAVVMIDGRVVATWTHATAKKTLVLTVDPFRKLSPSTLKQVRAGADVLADALGLTAAVVKVA